jgi:hypothetical protein
MTLAVLARLAVTRRPAPGDRRALLHVRDTAFLPDRASAPAL